MALARLKAWLVSREYSQTYGVAVNFPGC